MQRDKIEKNEIHLWKIKLDPAVPNPNPAALSSDLSALSPNLSTLSKKEIERADRFIHAKDRNRFIRSRSALRSILSAYTRIQADELKFEYGPNNKPTLAECPGAPQISFNLSHSHELILIAATLSPRRIGVDLERIRELKQIQNLLDRFCSTIEREEYEALPLNNKVLGFFNLWSRKEAFVKAWGESIIGTIKMNQLTVSFAPDSPAKICSVPGPYADGINWFIEELKIDPGYSSCVVAERFSNTEKLSLQIFDFNDFS